MQGDLKSPPNWFVNCTPGGKFSHITAEVCNARILNPSCVVYLVGTNEIGMPIANSYEGFVAMLKAGGGKCFQESRYLQISCALK